MADEHTDTPPVAGASSVLDDVVEIALAASLEHDVLNPGDGAFACLRAALTAALPHLTAERDAETTALRASELDANATLGRTVRLLAAALGLDPQTVRLDDLIERAENLRTRDAAWKAYAADLVATLAEIECVAWRGVDKGADVAEEIYQTMTPRLPAVLADPAPTTEHLDAGQLPADRVERLAQWLHGRNIGICEMDSDLVYNGLDSMRELAQALLQHGPDGIRITALPTPGGPQ